MRRIRHARPTLPEEWQPEFAAALAASGLAPLTVRAYRHAVRRFLAWLQDIKAGPPQLPELSAADVLSYRQHLVNVARLRAATINQRLQAIRWLCQWAMDRGRLQANPAAAVHALRVATRRQPARLTEPEVHALLRGAGESKREQAKRNYALLQVLLQTGVRVGELTQLQIGDVHLCERSGEVRICQGKGNQEREIPLNASARRALRAYLQGRPGAQPREPLFLSDRHRPMSARTIQALLGRLARRAKITRVPVTPHRCRHTFALNYLRDHPGKLVELAALLGHESLDTTAIYTQPSREELAEDLERSRLNVYG